MANSLDSFINDFVTVEKINPDGQKFDRVSRCVASNPEVSLNVVFDYNNELLSLNSGDVISVTLVKDSNIAESSAESIFEAYDYVMHGKVFKIESGDSVDNIYISFGGLLLRVSAKKKHFAAISSGTNVYMLLRRQ